MSARVFLGEILVGELTPDLATQSTTFEFDPAYAANAARPVLGRTFEDRVIAPPRRFGGRPMPTFFRNLLPEGALRKIVEARLGASALPEYAMLLRLGEHLPGAVRVVGDALDPDAVEEVERSRRAEKDPYRFALTGVQPKLAVFEDDDRLTVPIEGQDGYWIAKFGSPSFQKLVENEFAMLESAAACGLNVPEHRLVHAHDIRCLPEEFDAEQSVLVVRRFDRTTGGGRIHQEDFAQVFDIAPEEKDVAEIADLGFAHYGSVGAVVLELAGEDDYREYLRRLVFMALSGNADAHVKNWALIYPGGLRARLAPVYDFVSTVVYPSLPKAPAMRWWEPVTPTADRGEALASVTLNEVLAAASFTELDTSAIMDDLTTFAARARAAWPAVAERAPRFVSERVSAHLAAIRL